MTSCGSSCEGKRLVEIEKERAKARQLSTLKQNSTDPENLPERKGDSRDLAAGKLGMSGKTLDRGIEVLDAMDRILSTDSYYAARGSTSLPILSIIVSSATARS